MLFRTPYQNDPDLRKSINEGRTNFFDMHLSMLPQAVRYGFLGPVHWAVIEACDVTASGEITLTSSVGAAPTFCRVADKIIIELNRFHPAALRGFHDIYEPRRPAASPADPILPPRRPHRRAGRQSGPEENRRASSKPTRPMKSASFSAISETTARIGENVAEFLAAELQRGLIPKCFLPIQSGVGDTANAVLKAMGEHPEIPVFDMYTEVIQDAVIALIKQGKVRFASGCSLTVTNPVLRDIYEQPRILPPPAAAAPAGNQQQPGSHPAPRHHLHQHRHRGGHHRQRQQHPRPGPQHDERHRRLRRFCPQRLPFHLHLPLHRQGRKDQHHRSAGQPSGQQRTFRASHHHRAGRRRFARQMPRPSAPKPSSRTAPIPDYRGILRDYVALAGHSHSPQTLSAAFGLHLAFAKTGDMRNVKWADFN